AKKSKILAHPKIFRVFYEKYSPRLFTTCKISCIMDLYVVTATFFFREARCPGRACGSFSRRSHPRVGVSPSLRDTGGKAGARQSLFDAGARPLRPPRRSTYFACTDAFGCCHRGECLFASLFPFGRRRFTSACHRSRAVSCPPRELSCRQCRGCGRP